MFPGQIWKNYFKGTTVIQRSFASLTPYDASFTSFTPYESLVLRINRIHPLFESYNPFFNGLYNKF
jgi:hypothetical protein